jgi:hypothetical protein
MSLGSQGGILRRKAAARVKDKNLELLKFSYSKLHESLWESHKVAWTITSIFMPVIFALQGYLSKEYVFSTKQSDNVWILPSVLFR